MELKVGEKVKVISNKGNMHRYKIGDIVTCISENTDYGFVGTYYNFVDDEGLEQVLSPVHYIIVDDLSGLIKQCVQFNKNNLTDKYLDERNFKALELLYNL